MKRAKRVLVAIMICIMAMALPVSASAAKVNYGKQFVSVGHKLQLKVNEKSKKVKWSTSNRKVATVNKKGLVVGKKTGTVKITAKSGKNVYTWKVYVKANKFVAINQNPETWSYNCNWPTYNVLQMYYKNGKLYTKGFMANTTNFDYTKIVARVEIFDRVSGTKIASKNVVYNKLLSAGTYRYENITFNKSEMKNNFDLRTMDAYTYTLIY